MPKKKGVALPTNPHIRIIVKGLILCSAQEGGTPAKIGMLRNLDEGRPHHKKEITVIRTIGNPYPPIPDVNVANNCRLCFDIAGTSPAISLYQPIARFNRMNRNDDPQDFRWITSMEAVTTIPDLSGYVNSAELSPIVQIDRGIFYTYERADVETELRGVGKPEPYGYIADTLGIDVVLPTGSTATFTNGSNTIFRLSESSTDRYMILIDRDCNQTPGVKCRSDFTQIYKAIGNRLGGAQKRDIHRLGAERDDPEIPCLGGHTKAPLP